jgi:riboflavin synthase
MFTGIVEAVGQIASVASRADDVCLTIVSDSLDFSDVKPGDSIAINGVCLTVVALQGMGFDVDVSAETLSCTNIGALAAGHSVNLEKALLPTTRLGGHLVSGHVDGIAVVSACHDEGSSRRIDFTLPEKLSRYIAVKGSVCIDGVSLTVNEVQGNVFSVNIIPHTRGQTVVDLYQPGSRVNLEVDLIARYLERLLGTSDSESAVDAALLQRAGFSHPAADR